MADDNKPKSPVSTQAQAQAQQSQSQDSNQHDRLEEVALELFSGFVGRGIPATQFKQAGAKSFQAAQEFLNLSDQIRAGEISIQSPASQGPQLADCCAPNLDENHPFNLMSQRFALDGVPADQVQKKTAETINRIRAIYARLKDIHPENYPDDDKKIFKEEGVSWTKQEVSIAKKLFPQFVS